MAEIKPFKALLYNKDKIFDFSKVTCPPYDVITKHAQAEYYRNSPYNIIRLILSKDTIQGRRKNNRYAKVKRRLDSWLSRGVMQQDKKEAFYFHKHKFKVGRKNVARYGIIGLLKLERSVLGHEKTKTAPKKDRLRIIRKVRANLSPIFVLFSDTQKIINKVVKNYVAKRKAFVKFADYEGNKHWLWKIQDDKINKMVAESTWRKHMFIADGHHRYSVGLKFASEMQKKCIDPSGKHPWDYIMSYFADMNSEGLVILPVHRLIKRIDKKQLKDMLDIFKKYFTIDIIYKKADFLAYFEKKQKDKHCFGLYFEQGGCFYILKLKSIDIVKKLFPKHKSEFHSLEVFVLEELVIKKILGIKDKSRIDYTPDAEKALEAVDNNKYKAAFLISPTEIEDIKRIALIRGHMPAKSTYFYPKVLTGLTLHKF